jgi:hypothetical protein
VSVLLELVITKLAPTVLAETPSHPGVPPSALEVMNIRLLAVTEVLATVAVPPTKVTIPSLELPIMGTISYALRQNKGRRPNNGTSTISDRHATWT